MTELLALPFLACLVLTGMHVYLGLHVLVRGIIFVDLALAQVAALGLTVAILAGHPVQSEAAYWYALAFALGGAMLFSLTRMREATVPQEAIIGIVYAVSAALAVLVVDRAPQGAEHIKQLLVGSILTVSATDVIALAGLYAALGVLLWWARRPMLEISLAPQRAVHSGRRVVLWDVAFYGAFALVVTSSVRLAGVLLVFSYLVVPTVIAAMFARGVGARLGLAWTLGVVVSGVGLLASWQWDWPTGATIVATFGAAIALTGAYFGLARALRVARTRGVAALAPVWIALGGLVAFAGALLAVFPRADHLWLNALEGVLPVVQETFLTADERVARRDALEAIDRGETELARLRAMAEEVRWGARAMDADKEERLRQFIAGRSEIVAGDRLVLQALRAKARERQRYWLGVPLVVVGGALSLRALKSARR